MKYSRSFEFFEKLAKFDIKGLFALIYEEEHFDLNMKNEQGMCALHLLSLVKPNSEYLAFELLRHETDVNIIHNSTGCTPLHYAVMHGNLRLIDLFLYYKADVSIKNNDGDSVLHLAAMNGNLIVLAKILKSVKDPELFESLNKNGKSFAQLFTKTIQVQIYNRYKVVNKISLPPRVLKRVIENICHLYPRDPDLLYALIAIEDFDGIKAIMNKYKVIMLDDSKITLNLSSTMKKYFKMTRQSHYLQYSTLRKLFIVFTFHAEPQEKIRLSEYLQKDYYLGYDDDVFGALSNETGFSLFNYICTLCDEKLIERNLGNEGYKVSNYQTNLNCSNSEILTRFHPEMALKLLPFTTFIIKNLNAIQENCPICRDDTRIGDDWIRLKCTHKFHEHCLMEWMSMQRTCPMCRRSLNFYKKIKSYY